MWKRSLSKSTSNDAMPGSPDRAFSTRLGQSRQPSFSNFAMSLTWSVTWPALATGEGPFSEWGVSFLARQPATSTAIPSIQATLTLWNMYIRLSPRLAPDALVSHPLVGTTTLLLFVCDKPFNFNRNIRPHSFLEAGHMTKELLLGLLWRGRPPIPNKDDCARVNGRIT